MNTQKKITLIGMGLLVFSLLSPTLDYPFGLLGLTLIVAGVLAHFFKHLLILGAFMVITGLLIWQDASIRMYDGSTSLVESFMTNSTMKPIWFFHLCMTLLFLTPLRRFIISLPLMGLMKKFGLVPKISKSDSEAIFSGSSWIEKSLFNGRPDFKTIMNTTVSPLPSAERAFLDNQVEEVCEMINDWDVAQKRDLPKPVWDYFKKEGFFGMLIPQKYGGLGFSAKTQSLVIQKLASRNYVAAITVMVPNSLGPGELIEKYGTPKQKSYYLPRLAKGEEIPCFGLTEPFAGSDATSVQSNGVLFKEDGKLKIRLNFEKRYITLGAASTLIGLAFVLRDPEKLLGGSEEVGITCAMVPATTKGVTLGRRHDPMGVPFYNSPLNGKDVVIDLEEFVIGGLEMVGKGWKMVSEALAAGRGISLPALSTASAKFSTYVLTHYTQIRKQFGLAIGKFEGVQEVLSEVGYLTYLLESVNNYTLEGLDLGVKPPVVTAINKYHFTEISRKIINHSMDILGGKAIIRGPKNYMAHNYNAIPIAITVEGANILTRTMIQYGQAMMLCNPYMANITMSIEGKDLKGFDRSVFGFIQSIISSKFRFFALYITRGFVSPSIWFRNNGKYLRKLYVASTLFDLFSNIAIVLYGGSLRRKEMLTGKLGDMLSWMYMVSAAVSVENQKTPEQQKNNALYFKLAMKQSFNELQKSALAIADNIVSMVNPFSFIVKLLLFIMPLGRPVKDSERIELVNLMLKRGETFKELTKDVFVSKDMKDPVAQLENAVSFNEKSHYIMVNLRKWRKEGKLHSATALEQIDEAFKEKLITKEEHEMAHRNYAQVLEAISVDSFEIKDYLAQK